MTKIRDDKGAHIQDRRTPAQKKYERTKIANLDKGPVGKPPRAPRIAYTPSPGVKGSRPGTKGGYWTNSKGKTVATGTSEDARPKRTPPRSNTPVKYS